MRVNVIQGSIQEIDADVIIVNLFEGVTTPDGATGAVDRTLNGAISELISAGDIIGKLGETAVLYLRGEIPANRVIIVGLGNRETFDLESVRQASAFAVKRGFDLKVKTVASVVHGSGVGGLDVKAAAQATLEGALLATYRYDAPKSKHDSHEIESFTLVEYESEKISEVNVGLNIAISLADGVKLARDLVNMPPNVATPSKMAGIAQQIAEEHGMLINVGDREWAARHQMGAYLAVAKGAGEEPKFIVLEHNRGRDDLDTIVLVGKGITFDTGGISLKPAEKMGNMKSDMAGAAAVLGAIKVVGLLNLQLHIVAITPCTENMPDAHAYHPGDVIMASNQKTIEIISTDAEGRLILADALVYAKRYDPKAVVDLATLTGACVIALGKSVAGGIFSNNDHLQEKLVTSGSRTRERIWPLPLWDDYKTVIKSDVADMKNSGGSMGGVGASAILLSEFTDYPWAHIDMAGMVFADKTHESPYIPTGATGFGVRMLVDFLLNWNG